MRCSVVIPCHGGADLTRACLASLFAQDGDHELEVLLVDNAGDPATQALAQLDRRIAVLPQTRNLGFAGGCNEGLRRAQMPFALVLNNDTQAAAAMLTRLEAALLRDDRIAFAAPVSNRVKGRARIDCGDSGGTADGRGRIEREICDPMAFAIEDVDSLSGLCLLGRTATWSRLQGFDERFVPGNFEDDDLSLRARLCGWRLVIARGAFVHHEAHRTFRALGIDVAAEIHRQHAVFRHKWRGDDAGLAVLTAIAGDHAAAAAAARRARSTHPEWPDADWHVARDLVGRSLYAAAVPHLQALLRHSPTHTEAILQLGKCWLHLGELPRAHALWRWAIAHCALDARQGAEMMAGLGERAQQTGDLEVAAAQFEAALELRPDDPVLLNRLGAVRVEQRRFAAALPLLERAAELGLALAHTNLGICHFQSGDRNRALLHFARAAEQLPDDVAAQQNYQRARAAAGAATAAPSR